MNARLEGQRSAHWQKLSSERNLRMGLFSSSLFRRKDVEQLIGEMNQGERLHRRLGPARPDGLGIGATIGTGLYVQTGVVAKEIAGPVADALVPAGGRRLRVRGALLFRAREHGARGRQCLHLCVCDAGRAGGLDHRLGPHPGVRHRLERRRRGLVEPSGLVSAKCAPHPARPAVDCLHHGIST